MEYNMEFYHVRLPCQFLDFIIWNNPCALYVEYLGISCRYLGFIIWNNPCALYMEYTLMIDFWQRFTVMNLAYIDLQGMIMITYAAE